MRWTTFLLASLMSVALGAVVFFPHQSDAQSSPSVYWGAYLNGAPYDQSVINTFESDAGKRMSVLMFGQPWQMAGSFQAFPAGPLTTIRNRGTIPMLDWPSW